MKKRILIFVLIFLILMPSCSVFPIIPQKDKPEEDPTKAMFIGAQTMFSDFFFDAYSAGTELDFSDFEALRLAKLRKDSVNVYVNSLSVLGRELASNDRKLSMSATSLRNNEKEISYDLTDITYGSEKLSLALFSSNDSSVAAFSCLANTYAELGNGGSVKEAVLDFLSSDSITTERFSLSRADCRYGDSVIKDTQKIALDLSEIDLSPLISELFDCLDPFFRFADERDYILKNVSSPFGTGITVYIKNGRTICAEAVFTVSGTEYRANALFDSSDSYQSAKISFTKSYSPIKKIFHLDFVQATNNGKKSGTVSADFFPAELFDSSDNTPSSVSVNANIEADISGNRQNYDITAKVSYTLYGITSSYTLPISIVTELFDGVFSASVSLSAENPEISELDARISFTASVAKELNVPIIAPETVLSVQTKEQADSFLSSFFSSFEKKCPNLRYLIFKNYRNQSQSPISVLTAKDKRHGETFVFQLNDLSGTSLSGSGEYIKEFTYTENGDTLLISESSGSKYPLYTSSAKKDVCEDGSVIITERSGTVWRLFPSDMTGYFSKPVTLSASIDSNTSSGKISVFFADSTPLFEKADFSLTGDTVKVQNNEYEYSIY